MASPFFHLNGTVKMGKFDDPMACVDSHFRIRGIQSLRIVDLSICPITPKYCTDPHLHFRASSNVII
jgi:choline dehydrogenase-like flavoprotein